MPDSSEELERVIAVAESATSALKDPELRRVAFEKVLDHLLAGRDPAAVTEPSPVGTAQAAPVVPVHDADGALASGQQRADALAHYFRVSPENVRHIFDVAAEEPDLVVSPSRLTNASAVATREITLLVAGSRTALGKETTTTHIREVADHFGKLDSGNFMTTLARMSEISVLGRPKSPNRVVRMRATGAEAAQALAQRITSE